MGEHRLLTLTGAGGSGKTRMAIELATRVGGRFPDGIHFVALAAVDEPTLIPSSIAQCLGLADSHDVPLVEHVGDHLRGRLVLLILDNVEQVMAGAPLIAALIAATDTLHVLVTSRSSLHLDGEQELPVGPLELPPSGAEPSPASLAQWESTALFLDRARAVAPDFLRGTDEAAAVVQIVRRLDGLPLAIELAAARVKELPLASIFDRLDGSLGLLVGGHRDAPARHQTLRATLTWSFDLLGENARQLLTMMGAFRGGAALTDLERVCGSVHPELPVLEAVGQLVDHHLLRLQPDPTDPTEPRYTMLEAVRELAVERLNGSEDAQPARRAHSRVFAELAAQVERPPIWPAPGLMARLDRDHDNLRAALDWLQAHDPTAALATAAHLTGYWSVRGHFGEGRRRLATLLGSPHAGSPERAAALRSAAWLAMDQGDLEAAIAAVDEALILSRVLGDRVEEGAALLTRGRAALGGLDLLAGGDDVEAAHRVLSAAGDAKGAAAALFLSGLAPQFTGDLAAACSRYDAAVQRCAELGLTTVRARTLQLLGLARVQAGEVREARDALAEGVPIVVESGDRFGIAVGLGGLVGLAAVSARPRLALRLAGALDEFVHAHQVVPPRPLHDLTERLLEPARLAVGPAAEAVRAEGRRLSVADALAAALSDEKEQRWGARSGTALTGRETEVAGLLASGLTNREIAARLVLSVRTVEAHVDRVLTKLGFHSRTQLAVWAHETGVLAQPRGSEAPDR